MEAITTPEFILIKYSYQIQWIIVNLNDIEFKAIDALPVGMDCGQFGRLENMLLSGEQPAKLHESCHDVFIRCKLKSTKNIADKDMDDIRHRNAKRQVLDSTYSLINAVTTSFT
jgi:hypothetical protein